MINLITKHYNVGYENIGNINSIYINDIRNPLYNNCSYSFNYKKWSYLIENDKIVDYIERYLPFEKDKVEIMIAIRKLIKLLILI